MPVNYFPVNTRTNNCKTKFISRSFASESGNECVSLTEAKNHLYIDSGNSDFDTILTAIIKQAREYVEEITALSLISRTVTAYFDYSNEFTIPFGPVTTFTSAEIKTGINTWETKTVNEDYELVDQTFISYSGNYRMRLIYVAGYTSTTVPAGLKLGLLNEIALRFEHRGDNPLITRNGSVLLDTNDLVQPYKMIEWLI